MPRSKIIPMVIMLGFIILLFFYFHERQNNTSTITLFGNVDVRQVSLSFRVPGRLQAMLKEEGESTVPGELIARLDKDTYEEDLARAEGQLAEAKAAFQNAKRTYLRRLRLVGTGAVSKALFEQAEASRDETSARLKSATAELARAKTSLKDTGIYAPSAGTILTRVQEPGAVVSQGQPVYTLTIASPVWVRAFVDEPQLGLIFPNQKAEIYTDTAPDKPYQGHIGFISPEAEFTPKTVETQQLRTSLVYQIRVVVDNPDHGLRQGMPVTVKILAGDEGKNG